MLTISAPAKKLLMIFGSVLKVKLETGLVATKDSMVISGVNPAKNVGIRVVISPSGLSSYGITGNEETHAFNLDKVVTGITKVASTIQEEEPIKVTMDGSFVKIRAGRANVTVRELDPGAAEILPAPLLAKLQSLPRISEFSSSFGDTSISEAMRVISAVPSIWFSFKVKGEELAVEALNEDSAEVAHFLLGKTKTISQSPKDFDSTHGMEYIQTILAIAGERLFDFQIGDYVPLICRNTEHGIATEIFVTPRAKD